MDSFNSLPCITYVFVWICMCIYICMCVCIDIYELFELFIKRVHVIKFVLFLVCFLEKWWIIKALLLFLLVYLIYNVE